MFANVEDCEQGSKTSIGNLISIRLFVAWHLVTGLSLCGCTSLQTFVHNGFKVGPNYQRPPAPLAPEWIDSRNPGVRVDQAEQCAWWTAFQDPVLENLVRTAYDQNVDLRIAGTRVLQARAQRAIAVGTLFPQQQQFNGSFQYIQSKNSLVTDVNIGPTASWEIDFWGRFRRTIESADGALESSVDDYDNVLVSLIGDVAASYVQYRLTEQQLAYVHQNITIQKGSLQIARDRWKAGETNELSVEQGVSLLEQLEASVPLLEIALRQTSNQLCVLLGMPPVDLAAQLGTAPIPASPPEIVVGIPADLIRRRPDVRSAERLIAAQNAQIGVAEANLYPAFFVSGSLGWEWEKVSPNKFQYFQNGNVGPAFQWDILNYGRNVNNIRFQDFKTRELVGVYQQKVLNAAREVENGIATFLNSRKEKEHLHASVKAAERALNLANIQFKAGAVDYTTVFVAQQFVVQQQNLYSQAQADIALGMIGVYRRWAAAGKFACPPPIPRRTPLCQPLKSFEKSRWQRPRPVATNLIHKRTPQRSSNLPLRH